MKKALAGLFLFVILAILSVYILIPAQLNISEVLIVKANTNSLFRYLSSEKNWVKWWPDEGSENQTNNQGNHLQLNRFTYHLSKKLYNAVDVETIKKDNVINGKIFIIPLAEDSLIVKWQNSFTTSRNPFTRFLQYQQAVNMKKNMTVILNSLKGFSENKNKTYGFHIHLSTLKDTFYMAEKKVTKDYPATPVVYQSIKNLQKYISGQKAGAVGFPILNVTKKDSLHYEMMVALPVNKILSGTGNIAFKRMIVYENKILTADVKGGPEKIKEAYNELNTYIKDYNLTMPVISWETLITDRSNETDSTKWITKICVPIA